MGRIVDFRPRTPKGWDHRPGRDAQPRRCVRGKRRSVLPDRLGFLVFAALCVGALALHEDWSEPTVDLVGYFRPEPATAPSRPNLISQRFSLCGSGRRITCVVDGDTLWIGGEKIRVADINTPETAEPQCRSEAQLGERAKRRLVELVNAGPFELRQTDRDQDRYGRSLRVLVRNGRSLGATLVAEGLAHSWDGARRSWCA